MSLGTSSYVRCIVHRSRSDKCPKSSPQVAHVTTAVLRCFYSDSKGASGAVVVLTALAQCHALEDQLTKTRFTVPSPSEDFSRNAAGAPPPRLHRDSCGGLAAAGQSQLDEAPICLFCRVSRQWNWPEGGSTRCRMVRVLML